MKRHTAHWQLAIACIVAGSGLAAAAADAPATGTWRCGNSYADRPCEGGKAMAPDTLPSTQQVRDADERTRRVQAAAERMETGRLQREKARPDMVHLPAPSAAQRTPVESARPAGRANKARTARKASEFFTAAGPRAAKTTKKKKASPGASAG